MNTSFIKIRMYQMGLTQGMLAERIPTKEGKHISESALSNILTGKTDPRKSTIDKIAKALGAESSQII